MTIKTSFKMIQPDDWHVHFRRGKILKTVVHFTSKIFYRAFVMPNVIPPITTVKNAENYRKEILDVVANKKQFIPLMVFYLTDNTDVNELVYGYKKNIFYACKLYPINSTINSEYGVSDIKKIYHVLSVMEYFGIPLLIHGELAKNCIDIFDREAEFIKQIMLPLRNRFPMLKVVLEHITTKESVEYVLRSNQYTAATITPHHLMFNRNHMLSDGIKPHFYSFPILKRKKHQEALQYALTTGCDRFFLGTDTAPHFQSDKESCCGKAGIFNAPIALSMYATVFEKLNILKYFEAFCSLNGPKFYNLPINKDNIILIKKSDTIYDSIDCYNNKIIPFLAGKKIKWSVLGN
ncbi:dihydroorotase [Candidatus Providencia siddallii]|uniref:Dihydroorotase n=1 Tax=Candidatus Providencia siddallii TaxID=1715285 RepID=A0ABP1CE95_9GAMM